MRGLAATIFWGLVLVAVGFFFAEEVWVALLFGAALSVVGFLWLQMQALERRLVDMEQIVAAGLTLGTAPPPTNSAQPPAVVSEVAPTPVTPPAVVPDSQPVPVPSVAAPATPPVTKPAEPPFDWTAALRAILGPLAGGQASSAEAEQQIGVYWFSRIGGLLLVASALVGYFLLPSALLQALIGWAVGLGIIGAGAWAWRAGYRPWSQAVTGAGLGILYAVTGAAAVRFEPAILSRPVAFALMTLITAGATALAVGYNSPSLGLLGMLGGFATPFVLSTGEGDFRVLFAYLVILDLGLLAVAWFRRWPLYNQILFVATWSIWGMWRATNYIPADATAGFLFTSLFFLLFIGVSVLYNLVHRQAVVLQELMLLLLNGFLYFTAGLDFLGGGFPRVLFAFGVAALYAALGLLARRRSPDDRALTLGFLGLGVTFLTVAFPVAFDGPWVTLAWAVEGAGLTWVGARSDLRSGLAAGLVLYVLAVSRLLILDSIESLHPLLVVRAVDFLGVAAALYAGAWLYRRNRAVLEGTGTLLDPGPAMGLLAVVANGVTLWWISLEIVTRPSLSWAAKPYWLAAAWAAYGLLLAVVARRWPFVGLRAGARLVLAVPLLLLLPLFAIDPAPIGLRMGVAVGVLGALWLAEYLVRPTAGPKEGAGLLSLAGAVVGALLLRLEIWNRSEDVVYLHQLNWLSQVSGPGASQELVFGWARMLTVSSAGLYGLAAMLVSRWLRSRSGKLVAAGLFWLSLLFALSDLPDGLGGPWVVRLAAFAALIGGACLAGYLARLQGEDLRLHGWLSLGAAGLTAFWGALEIAKVAGEPAWIAGDAIWLGLFGLGLVLLCLRLRSLEGRLLGMILVAGGLLLGLGGPTLGLLVWPRWAAWLAPAGALWLFPWLLRRFRREEAGIDLDLSKWAALAAVALALPWLYLEASNWPGIALPSFLVSALWGGWSFLVLAAGFLLRHRETRLLAISIVGLTLLKVGLVDMWTLAFIWRVWIGAGIGTLLLLASLAYQRFGARLLR